MLDILIEKMRGSNGVNHLEFLQEVEGGEEAVGEQLAEEDQGL